MCTPGPSAARKDGIGNASAIRSADIRKICPTRIALHTRGPVTADIHREGAAFTKESCFQSHRPATGERSRCVTEPTAFAISLRALAAKKRSTGTGGTLDGGNRCAANSLSRYALALDLFHDLSRPPRCSTDVYNQDAFWSRDHDLGKETKRRPLQAKASHSMRRSL